MKLRLIWYALTLLAFSAPAHAKGKSNCALLQRLAQQHSNDMARRESMDHAGFSSRAAQGARAENVATGSKTRAGAMAQWWTSPGHAANMLLPGCKMVAHAVSKSGRYYWTMLIGR
ncbi:MAG: CAP domain-containing protein [Xanthobacteraceae bacterium]|nr:CAP domain-containing protein [Xanthobacteraceae bacterium]